MDDPTALAMTTCTKLPFPTKADARRYIKKHRGRTGFYAKHAYECRRCGKFHITSQPQHGESRL